MIHLIYIMAVEFSPRGGACMIDWCRLSYKWGSIMQFPYVFGLCAFVDVMGFTACRYR